MSPVGKSPDLGFFVGDIAAVEDDAPDLGITAVGKIGHSRIDIIGRIEGHLFARRDDEDLFGIAFADRRRKAAADDVAQDIVQDDVRLVFFKKT